MTQSDQEPTDPQLGWLVVERSDESNQLIPVARQGTLRIGRVADNEIIVAHRLVSRFHAILASSTTGLLLSDLSSLNGTYLNEQRITFPVVVSPGDVVSIGDVRITYLSELLSENSSEAMGESTQPESMRHEIITIVLADISSYTSMSEKLPADEVASMLSQWIGQTSEIVRRHGGEVDKYIGDAVMALWSGTQAKSKQSACKALKAAQEILEQTAALDETAGWPHSKEFPWRCRISLNTGEALRVMMGTGRAKELTAIGDTINTAFRLNDEAKALQASIVMSDTTANLVKDSSKVVRLKEVQLEGKSKPLEVYGLP